jgi:hypothetical protein
VCLICAQEFLDVWTSLWPQRAQQGLSWWHHLDQNKGDAAAVRSFVREKLSVKASTLTSRVLQDIERRRAALQS